MSATMKNVEVLGKWIDGSYYNCEYRPIPLYEYIVSNVQFLPCLLIIEFNNIPREAACASDDGITSSENGRRITEFCCHTYFGNYTGGKLGLDLLFQPYDDRRYSGKSPFTIL